MNLEKYETLTGITVPTSQEAKVNAQIKRVRSLLETKLGFPLTSKEAGRNRYSELGKTTSDFDLDIDEENLDPPDEVEYAYRLFPYNEHDRFLSIDPSSRIHAVKLVYIKGGSTPNGITLKTFDQDEYRVHYTGGTVAKYLEKIEDCWDWVCECDYKDHVQLAVDADWLDFECCPPDLQYLWADMVQYYTDPNLNLKSQTLGSHSYTRATVSRPEEMTESVALLAKYAGPNGSLKRSVTL